MALRIYTVKLLFRISTFRLVISNVATSGSNVATSGSNVATSGSNS